MKKCLTKGKDGDIIDKLSRKSGEAHWSLKIEQQEMKYKAYFRCVKRRISQFLENTTQTKVKRADEALKKVLSPKDLR